MKAVSESRIRRPLGESPLVSVIMPAYNEQAIIGRSLGDILKSDYPHGRMEVLVVDGRSEDGTREIVRKFAAEDSRVRLLDNPKRQKSAALNLAIGEAMGEVIIRVDAHAEYPPEYVRRLVECLGEFDADNAGSLRRTHVPSGLVGAALAVLVDSKFAAGNAHYRTGASSVREVESVFGGCYRREIFEEIGGFDERLTRCQDRDLNDRLIAAGGRIVLDPSFSCTYHAREKLPSYLGWQADGGEWVFRAGIITGRSMVKWRNLVPLGFLVYLLSAVGLSFLPMASAGRAAVVAPGLVYLTLDVAESGRIARRQGRRALFVALVALFPLNHLAYAWGTVRALAWGIREKC